MIGDSIKVYGEHQIESEFLDGEGCGQNFSFACRVAFFGAFHSSAVELQQVDSSLSFLLS